MKHWNGGALLWAGLVLGNSVLFLYGTVIAPAELLDSYAVPKMLVCMFPWTGLLLKSCKDGISESSTEELRRNLYLLLWGVTALTVSTLCYAQRTLALVLGFPAFAMLTGWNIDRMVREGKSYFAGWARVSVLTFVVAAAGCHVAAGVLVFFILYVFLLPVAGGEKVAEAFSISIPSVHLLAREFF